MIHPSGSDGHISRNIRLVLKLIELVEPNVLILKPPQLISLATDPADISKKNSYELTMSLLPVGCRRVDALELLLLRGSCESVEIRSNLTDPSFTLPPEIGRGEVLIDRPRNCSGVGIWEDWKIEPNTFPWSQKSLDREGTGVVMQSII